MKRVIKVYSIFILTFVLFQTNSLYAEEYKGKVVTLSDQILSISTGAYDRGWILYIAKLGQILTPSVYDSDGKIVQKGTILIHRDPSTWSPYYYAYKKELELAGENKVLTYKLFEMTKTLASDNAISEQQLSSGRTQYEGALGQFANNEQLVIQAELTVERMISRAVFEGIVTNVTQASGSDVGNAPAIEFVQLNPIGIKIDMPIEKQMRLKPSTSIQIYI